MRLNFGCVLVYRYTKERNINELRHNSMYGYENNRNSPVYRYTRTAPRPQNLLADNIIFSNEGDLYSSRFFPSLLRYFLLLGSFKTFLSF